MAKLRWTGERLGNEAARVAKAIQTEPVPDPSIDYAEDWIPFHFRWNPENIAGFSPSDMSSRPFEYYFPDTNPSRICRSPPFSSTSASP